MSSTTDTSDEPIALLTAAAAAAVGTRVTPADLGRSLADAASGDEGRTDEERTDEERTDAELVLAFVRGDLQALAALYDRMAGLVTHNVHRLLGQRARPQDVVQATFLDVWHDAAHFDPSQGSALGWVLTIMHHHAEDPLRSEKCSPAPIDETE